MGDGYGGYCGCVHRPGVFSVKLFRVVQNLLKVTAVVCDATVTAHFGVIVHRGEGLWFTEYVAGYSASGFVILFIVSYLLNFCWRYRACIMHNFLAYTLMVIMRNFNLGRALAPMQMAVFASGLILIIIVLSYEVRGWNNKKAESVR